MSLNLINAAYLLSAVFFIVGLKCLSSPRTARYGNVVASLGMLVAIVVTLLHHEVVSFEMVWVGLIAGAVVGTVLAMTVQMTAMPQMVAVLNGFGGGASALVGGAELLRDLQLGQSVEMVQGIPIVLSILIGTVTLSGSFVAFGKLQGWISAQPVTFPLQKTVNALMGLAIVAAGVWFVAEPQGGLLFYGLSALCFVIGINLVIPIGGADMPVVISLLNSYSGIAAAAAGFVLNNNALIISGSLVGASGIILTKIMCRAMNRSLANVLFGAFGKIQKGSSGGGDGDADKIYRSGSTDDAAMLFDAASKVIVVPGYGMAVAQAQHAVRELADELAKRGCEVKYAIHPVAGRMPGHMNVLLAEANVPYEQLYEMDQINSEFPEADISLVIGANDITNPAARSDTSSPLYGMPILDVDRAKTIMVIKRSMRPGFAGVDNELYYDPKTMMVFGDAKEVVNKIKTALKELSPVS